MKRLSFKNGLTLLICGLSNGDLNVMSIEGGNSIKKITEIKLAHDFGVNSLDAKKVDEENFCVVSGGDD